MFKQNKKGQSEIQAIIGGIISIFFIIIFLSAMIPVFQSITGADDKQTEINKLNTKISEFEQIINNKEVEISQLRGILESLNSTIEEKDNIISNLSGQLTEKENQIQNLSNELNNFKEREYLPTINNNYYSILNYVERIENKFYTINLAIGLISLTLFGMVIKMFGLDVTIKLLWRKIKKKKTNNHKSS
jgi:septal ring factor EnvC (AmiA/AmiB activator)